MGDQGEVMGLSNILATMPPDPFTVDDLAQTPADGRRYELVDGSLIVSAAPVPRHQVAATRLYDLIRDRHGPGLLVLVGGAGIAFGNDRLLVPDLVVVRADADLAGRHLRAADVVLVAEVVSPSNAAHDLVLKRSVYEDAHVPHYWIVDTRERPSITLLDHDGQRYRERALGPDDEAPVVQPFRLTIRPRDLLP
jgi:Uma2 family endonuclease